MYSTTRLHESVVDEAVPFTMAFATPTYVDVEAIVGRQDGLTYNPSKQQNEFPSGTLLTMGRSTCNRRNSTGIVFLDNDRQQDD
ncbi:MAG: hypothetical protein H6907_10085 [Hyphomicrobiales bacterium]|nr:hypothetical protein [Hyphomicrobiales bacterium]MCP5372067.1 hypothetical protein [Hyphomicrobiales bacterium]